MCSSLTQIVFAGIMLGAIALTLGSTFSNKWRIVARDLEDIYSESAENKDISFKGILPWICEAKGAKCATFWKNMKQYEKIVAVCMIIALILEIVAFVWNFLTSCTCCFKKYLLHPLSPLSFLIVLFLSIAIGVFYCNSDEHTLSLQEIMNPHLDYEKPDYGIGSAFYLAVGAWVLAVLDTILASFAIFFAQHGI